MKKYVLVSGGAGYIGSHTILELIRQGYGVVSIDNFINSDEKLFENIKDLTGVGVKNFNLDLASLDVYKALVNRLESYNICGVIHFAALKSVPESMEKPFDYYHNNLKSTLNMLKIARKLNIKKFIFSSSCSVYGNVEQMPVDENTPFGKYESVYAHTKQMCEDMLEPISNNGDINIVSLRYFNPVGADVSGKIGDSSDGSTALVPIITKSCMNGTTLKVFGSDYNTTDGSCVRDYIHVTDLAQAHIKAIEYEHKGYDTFNIGTGTGTSVLEMIESFKKLDVGTLKYDIVDRRPGDIEKIYSDTTKAETLLGFKPKLSVYDMMQSSWLWENNRKKTHETI